MRRAWLIIMTTAAALLGVSSAAQALVLSAGGSGHVGVAPVPGTTVPSQSGTCTDPWLAQDLGGPNLPLGALCWHGQANSVLPATETFAVTWDPTRHDWATTRDYLEGFLKNVAGASGSLGSPYAVTTQYRESPNGIPAGNKHLYGGGCIDYGVVGQSTCRFPNAVVPAAGRDFPSSQTCKVSGASYDPVDSSASGNALTNSVCLTDADIQAELTHMVNDMGLIARTQYGYQPLLALMTPPGVEVCVDGAGTWCSANSTAKSQFCSYHSYVTVGGQQVAYVVQPWTAYTNCDPTEIPALPNPPSATDLATDVGKRLVSALSQAQIAAVTNPWLNGWYAAGNAEINDRCPRTDWKTNLVSLGGGQYPLQTEFNNAGVLEVDPNAPACALGVGLAPSFVPPSPIDAGDVVAFDGSVTASTLMISQAGYRWDFGDGSAPVFGASVVHTFPKNGTYTVTLTVVDRGGNQAAVSQTVTVGTGGSPVVTPPPGGGGTGVKARMQLVPQGLRSVLRSGIAVSLTSNTRADGIATLTITRGAAARAHIKHGRAANVVIGRGTVRGISNGTVKLHLHLPKNIAAKLRHLGHVALTVHLTLFAAGGKRITLDAAGRY
jgi:hypothetical protein